MSEGQGERPAGRTVRRVLAPVIVLALLALTLAVALWQQGPGSPGDAGTPTGEITVTEPPASASRPTRPEPEITVSGPWRVYTDEDRDTALLDLSFRPGGVARVLDPPEGTGRLSVTSWTYAQEATKVEVSLLLRMVDPAHDVDYTMQAWLHLTRRDDGTLAGAYEAHLIDDATTGTHLGRLRDARTRTVHPAVVAERLG